jgi:hypothetical protein
MRDSFLQFAIFKNVINMFITAAVGLLCIMVSYIIHTSGLKDIIYLSAIVFFGMSSIFFLVTTGFILLDAIEMSRSLERRLDPASVPTFLEQTNFLATTFVPLPTLPPTRPVKCYRAVPLPLRGRLT